LESSEKLIEKWRHELVAGLTPDPEVAAYLLVFTACSSIQTEAKAAIQAGDPGATEHVVRSNLFALQFGLQAIKGLPSPRRFNEKNVTDSIDASIAAKAITVHKSMKDYASARDVFLSYYYGAYNIESEDPRQLVFVDAPEWPGDIDFAETFLSGETKRARTPNGQYPPTEDATSEFPPNLDMGSISSDIFLQMWDTLAQLLAQFAGTGGAPVVERSYLVSRLCQATQLPFNVALRFVDLITLPLAGRSQLTLFHCPVVPLTQFDVQVVPPAVFGANISTTVLRLAVLRGPGIGAVSKSLEAFLLGRLQQHFSAGGNVIRLGRKYSTPKDKGDIDLVVYEPSSNVLTLAQTKMFIYPDSVPEVFDANQDIEKAITQINRTRIWFNAARHEERKAVLDLPQLKEDAEVLFTVLGNGFVGSDFLNHPPNVLFGDIRYLLRPEFQGASFQASLQSFADRLANLKPRVKRTVGKETIRMGEVEITFPAIVFEIGKN
jgi:hypothetical protein